MSCKQRSFAADWHQRLPVVCGLNLQQATGLSQIDEIDRNAEAGRKPTGCVKQFDRIEWPVTKDSQIDVTVRPAFTSRPASVEPCPQQLTTRKRFRPLLEHHGSDQTLERVCRRRRQRSATSNNLGFLGRRLSGKRR